MVDHATSSGQDISPVALLLRAVVKEYNKSVKMVFFGEDVKNVTIKFEDQTSLTAHFPDSTNQESYEVGKLYEMSFQYLTLPLML